MLFRDRTEAGDRLGQALEPIEPEHPIVLGLPRGGVPVAARVAHHLRAPLDVIIVRKLGVPAQPELALGAIGEDGVLVLNNDVFDAVALPTSVLESVERQARAELAERASCFRIARARLALTDRTVVVVDDGVATGSTAHAAILVARAHGARRVVLGVPVGPARTCADLAKVADMVVCLEQPTPFGAVGQFYGDFTQTTNEQVIECLNGQEV